MFVHIAENRTSIGSLDIVSYFNATASDRSMRIANERYGNERSSLENDVGKVPLSLLRCLVR